MIAFRRVRRIPGLGLLFHVRSPQSAENEARLEMNVDAVYRLVDPENAEQAEQGDKDCVR
jgi:hypothetical protein